MSTKAIIITGFIIFVVVMLGFSIYEMKHAYKVDPNDGTFLDKQTSITQQRIGSRKPYFICNIK